MPAPAGFPLADALLADAGRLLAEQRRAESVMLIARAFEVTLAGCAAAVLMAPAKERVRTTPAEVEMLRKRYMNTIGAMPLLGLRNVVIALVTRHVQPRTIAEALDFVEQSRRLGAVAPAREHIAALTDADARSSMEALRDASIIALCGAVIHQGYEPTVQEVEEQREAVTRLAHSLTALFRIA